MSTLTAAIDPTVARRNRILGLTLAGFVVGLVVVWMLVFTREGLPKDPKVWKRLQESRPAAGSMP